MSSYFLGIDGGFSAFVLGFNFRLGVEISLNSESPTTEAVSQATASSSLGQNQLSSWGLDQVSGSLSAQIGERAQISGRNDNQLSYKIQSGDTLGALANLFSTTVEKLANENGITNPNDIKAGNTINISY